MSQVLLWFLLPIGLYTYFVVEKRHKMEYQHTFDDFYKNVYENSSLSDNEKMKLYKEMLIKNGYTIVHTTEKSVRGEKKYLSLGLMMIGFGLYIVGLLLYLFYFYTI
ncbi:MAG: hypothetical protein B7Y52_02230, partial [Sulfurovum sp. 28-43-6]